MAVAVYLSSINSLLFNICDDRSASDCLRSGSCITYCQATPTRRKHMLKLPYQPKTGSVLNWLKHKKQLWLHKDSSKHPFCAYLLSFKHSVIWPTLFPSWVLYIFSLLVSPVIGSGAHPVSYPICTRQPSPVVQQPRSEADHLPPSSTKAKNECWYTSTPHMPSGCAQGQQYFTLYNQY